MSKNVTKKELCTILCAIADSIRDEEFMKDELLGKKDKKRDYYDIVDAIYKVTRIIRDKD